MIDRVAFVLGETLAAFWRNRWMAAVAVVTSALALYVLAGMAYVGWQASTYTDELQRRFEMTINLKEGADRAGIERTMKYLRATPGVASVVWVSGTAKWKLESKLHPEMTEGLGEESLYPESLRVRLSDLARTDAVADKARHMSTVDPKGGVEYFGEAQNLVARWIKIGRTLSFWVGGLLLAVAFVVIWNAVWLTVESRKTEVRIMRLVGASRIVVALPFVMEGIVQGLLGGALATAGLAWTHRAVETLLRERSMTEVLAPFPVVLTLALLGAAGGGYGGLCSFAALRTSLRTRRNG